MLKSVLIAAAIGAGILWAYEQTVGKGCASCSTGLEGLLPGAVVGAGTQIILRWTGVS